VVFEFAGEGTDTVIASDNYYLYQEIENLVLAPGAGSIFGVGNDLANTITGNEGSNLLLGGLGNDIITGGAGNDLLWGQGGADRFVISANTGVDTIGDFAVGVDKIDLSAYANISNFSQLLGLSSNVGADMGVNLGNSNTLILLGHHTSDLNAGDFIFHV
jgi:Ca2+-binding RTX toxin-like protein